MASSDNQLWLMLRHPGILDKIMLIVALDSLESLDSCRRVCKTWNTRIMNNIWENPTKKWGTIIQKRLERSWGNLIRKSENDGCYYLTSNVFPSDDKIIHAILLGKHRIIYKMSLNIVLETRGIIDPGLIENLAQKVIYVNINYSSLSGHFLPLIKCAASLAHHGLLGSLHWLSMYSADLSSVPIDHLASLVSSVSVHVAINNVSGFDLITFLDSVKSHALSIRNHRQSLGSEETQALVQAMESHLEKVVLHKGVTLDIEALMEYSGQGKCQEVVCYCDTSDRYKEQLAKWTTSRNWAVTSNKCISIGQGYYRERGIIFTIKRGGVLVQSNVTQDEPPCMRCCWGLGCGYRGCSLFYSRYCTPCKMLYQCLFNLPSSLCWWRNS